MNCSRRQGTGLAPVVASSVGPEGPRPSSAELNAAADRLLEAIPRTMRGIRLAMRSAAGSGLTVVQLRALSFVGREPGCGLSALAEHLGMTPPSASSLVDRLVRDGLLDRSTDPAERRRIRLEVTDAGAARVAAARRAARTWLRRRLSALSGDEVHRLAAALDLLERLGRPAVLPG